MQAAPPTHLQTLLHSSAAGATDAGSIRAARISWAKADAYHYRSMARLQRLWKVSILANLNLMKDMKAERQVPFVPGKVVSLELDRVLSPHSRCSLSSWTGCH